jgi:putative aldouronate transport system permease protein
MSRNTIKESKSERIFLGVVVSILILSIIITLYPFIFVISSSISDPLYVIKQEIWFLPKGFSLKAYATVFENKEIWMSYFNTIWYTVVGAALNIFITVVTAYPLAKKNFSGRKVITLLITFTMFFSGGLIPLFIIVNKLKLYDTRWAIVLPAAASAWNILIAKMFFQSIPEGLQEAAKIDGCSDIGTLFKVVVPLSMPIIAVIGLFSAVGFWNDYFTPMIFLQNPKYQPLQLYMMQIVINNSPQLLGETARSMQRTSLGPQLKYAIIIISVLPIVCVYPFLQKYFNKGVMIGGIKE